MAIACYTPLSQPTRLAVGLGLKEISYPVWNSPLIWVPRFMQNEFGLCSCKLRCLFPGCVLLEIKPC